VQLSTRVVHVPWRAPLRAAHGGETEPRPLVLVALEDADGLVGYGEAAPLASYDGVSLARVEAALARYAAVLAPLTAPEVSAGLAACQAVDDLPQALAAVDLALWDLAGRRAGVPVWQLLGAGAAAPVEINAVIGAVDPATAADAAAAAVRAGYRCIKVKVGVDGDLARVSAVRAAVGPEVAIRIDANGAWGSRDAAVSALAALAPLGIELCEEPVHGAVGISAVGARAGVDLAVDESTRDSEVFSRRVARAVCLKVAASGGITGMVDDAHRARVLGYEVFLASTLDGPLGIAAALHAATVIAPDRACGLSTLGRFAPAAPFTPAEGKLAPPRGPGLGDGLVSWYRAAG
jgi:L-alanine-DL-glutamate epimerase-like enolase superfamily enzyme